MKNRPLCSLCLVIAILIGVLTAGAGAKFVPELRPSPVEQYGEKDDWLIVRGQVYKKEEKENKTTSGIVLSTEKKEVPSIASVIAVGDECTSSLKENDRVIYKEYSGTKVTVDDQDYIVIDEKDIIAKFE